MTQKAYNDFIWKWNMRYAEYNNDANRNQCMDCLYFYIKEVVGVDPKPFQGYGNPVNLWNNFEKIKNAASVFEKIPNTPNGLPRLGDIMIYGPYFGLYGLNGHVDMFDHGDVYVTTCFGENYPTGAPCKFTKHGSNKYFHGYRGCKGWIRPR